MDTSEDGGVRVEVLMIQLSDHYLIWCATKMLIFIHPKKQKKNVDFHVAVTQWAFFWGFLILGLKHSRIFGLGSNTCTEQNITE